MSDALVIFPEEELLETKYWKSKFPLIVSSCFRFCVVFDGSFLLNVKKPLTVPNQMHRGLA